MMYCPFDKMAIVSKIHGQPSYSKLYDTFYTIRKREQWNYTSVTEFIF